MKKTLEEHGATRDQLLVAACRRGHVASATWLLEHGGASVNCACKDITDAGGGTLTYTPLQCAAEHGHANVVEFLLKFDGVDVNATGGALTRSTPVFAASSNGHADVVRMLMNHPELDVLEGCRSDGWSAMHIAVRDGHECCVRELSASGALVNLVAHLESGNIHGITPLMLACECEWYAIVRLLRDHPALNMALTNDDGLTAVELAEDMDNEDLLDILLADGEARSGSLASSDDGDDAVADDDSSAAGGASPDAAPNDADAREEGCR